MTIFQQPQLQLLQQLFEVHEREPNKGGQSSAIAPPESCSRLPNDAPYDLTRQCHAPGQFAIAGRKAIARLIEGVLRSLPHQRAAFGFNEHVRNAVHLAIKTGDMLFELSRKALALDRGHFAVRSAGDDQGARLAGYGVSVGLRDDGHVIAPFCFLTYGNALSKSSTKMPKGRK